MIRLLCAADVHLGRRPSRLPEELAGGPLSPAAAWKELVRTALRLRVDAVVLAGDLVEQDDDFYEAFVDLQAGVHALASEGIEVVGVAGNHDVAVLPRLAQAVPEFRLLGPDGEWGSHLIESGGARVRLVGRSFTADRMSADPLETLPQRAGSEAHIGVLHCDRDAAGSQYAPVRGADLVAAPVDAWLLGHVHRPDDLAGPRPIGYLGSLTGMDPGEAGPRGAWLLTVDATGAIAMEMLPLAPLRWDELTVDVSGLQDPGQVHGLVMNAVQGYHDELDRHAFRPAAVGLRLRVSGRSAAGRAVRDELTRADPRETTIPLGQVTYFFHSLRHEVLPAIDLAQLATAGTPVGLLARRLLLLRGPADDPDRRELLRRGLERLAEVDRSRYFAPLPRRSLTEEDAAELLDEAATRAIEELLAQREAAA